MPHGNRKIPTVGRTDVATYLTPTYGREAFVNPAPFEYIPDGSMDPRAALRLIRDDIDLDAPNSSDLGSYACDYMDPEADELIRGVLGKVFIDQSEYPKTAQIGHRVVKMIQRWYHGTGEPENLGEERTILGTVTIGSSEGIMLALVALRHNWVEAWKERRGLPGGATFAYYSRDKPFGLWARDVHTCWGKYSKYYNTPMLELNLSDQHLTIQPKQVDFLIRQSIFDLYHSDDEQYQKFGEDIVLECGYDITNPDDIAILKQKKLAELIYTVGCVVSGSKNSHIATLVERHTRCVMLVKVENKKRRPSSPPSSSKPRSYQLNCTNL